MGIDVARPVRIDATREGDDAHLVERDLVGRVAQAADGKEQRHRGGEEERLDERKRRGAGVEIGAERRQRHRDARDHEGPRELRSGDRGDEEAMGLGWHGWSVTRNSGSDPSKAEPGRFGV